MQDLSNNPIQQKQSSNNFLIYTLIVIILILIVFIGYIYKTKDFFDKTEHSNKYVKKNEINFDDLPSFIKDDYVLKSTHNEKLSELNSDITRLNSIKNDSNTDMRVEPKIIEKIVEVEKVIEVKVNEKGEVLPSLPIDKKNFKTYTCKSFKTGSIKVPQNCKRALYSFLNTNKDAKMFEVIGLTDKQEFRLIRNLEDVYGKNNIGNLAEYTKMGLSRQRVVETSWLIKEHLGKWTSIGTVNYSVTAKNKRGFVIRAYK